RPPVADCDAALSVLLPADLHRVNDRVLVAHVDVGGDNGARALIVQRRLERIGEGRLVKGEAGIFVERWLGVERLQMTIAAREEYPDDRLRLRGAVRPAGRRSVRLGRGGAGDAVAVQQGAERQAGEAHTQVGEEGTARGTAATDAGWVRVTAHGNVPP